MQLTKIEVAWAIFHQIISRSEEALVPVMTHPCDEQYECLTVAENNGKGGMSSVVNINLRGTGILMHPNSMLQYDEKMAGDQIGILVERIIAITGLRLCRQLRCLPGMEFIRELLAADKQCKICIANAWYDGSYHSCLTVEAKTFPHYTVGNDTNPLEHYPWWTITSNNLTIAMINLETDKLQIITGKKYNLRTEKGEALKAMSAILKNTGKKQREISPKFQMDLENGFLYPILKYVHQDNNLTIEVRCKYINIYYRGGNILRIREKKTGYSFEFDVNYIDIGSGSKAKIGSLPKHVAVANDVNEWVDMLPTIKAEMDTYFVTHKKAEREFQQLVIRENNIGGIAKSTDYYICDIEYQVGNTRFDLVAAKHVGKGKYRLALIEMKYADSALGGKSGIVDHVKKAHQYLTSNNINDLKKQMRGILETKRILKLVDGLAAGFSFIDDKEDVDYKPEFIFLLANHRPASKSLDTELHKLKSEGNCNKFYEEFCRMADLKIATASFFGYGLYKECVYILDEFDAINKTLLEIAKRRTK